MLSNEETIKWLKENRRDKKGCLDLRNLDLSKDFKDVYISGLIVKRNLLQGWQTVGCDLDQSNSRVEGSLSQGCHKVKKDIMQSGNVVGRDLIQNHQVVQGNLQQYAHFVRGKLFSHILEEFEEWIYNVQSNSKKEE